MGKIDDYNKQCRITANVISNLNLAQGLNANGTKDPKNDKYDIRFCNSRIWDTDFPMWLHASYGYYGSSSGYSACNENVGKYILKAVNFYMDDIVKYAMNLAKNDELKALKDCKDEAEKILADIKEAE